MKALYTRWAIVAYVLGCLLFIACERTEDGQTPGPNTLDLSVRTELPALLLDLEKRIINDPSDADLFAERAAVYADHDSIRNAINDLKRAIALDSTNAKYHLAVGQLYYGSLQVEQATMAYRTASRLDPNSLMAKLNLAEIQLVLRNYKSSFELVNEALRVDPHLAKGYYIKGWCYKELGDTAKAVSSFQTATEQDPSYYDAFMQLAMLHSLKGDDLAIAYFNSALDIRPQSVEALYDKGLFCQENGLDSLALLCYDEIKTIDPQNPLAWYNTGYVYLELRGDPEAANREFSRATALMPEYHQAWYNRGVVYELLNELDSAKAAYKTALRIAPAYDPAANGLSRLREKGVSIER